MILGRPQVRSFIFLCGEFFQSLAQNRFLHFTYAVQEFVQRQMVPAYERKRFDFEPFVKPDTAPNFLEVTRYQKRAGLDDLEYVPEKAEPRPGSVVDATKPEGAEPVDEERGAA